MRKRNLIGLLLIVTFIIVAVAAAHAEPAVTMSPAPQMMAMDTSDGHPYRPLFVIAQADPAAEVGPATVETPAPPTLPAEVDEIDEMASAVYEGVTNGNWFLVAGLGVTLLCWLLLRALEKKWWQFGNDRVRWVTVGVVAGLIGVANAYLSPDHSPDVETLIGTAKVFAAAVFAFYTAKKLVAPTNASHATPA